MKLDDVITSLLWTVGTAIWAALNGPSTDGTAKERIANAMLKAALEEAQILAAAAGITLAATELERRAREMLQAIREAEGGGGLPRILDGVEMREMPQSWKASDEEPTD